MEIAQELKFLWALLINISLKPEIKSFILDLGNSSWKNSQFSSYAGATNSDMYNCMTAV